MTGDFCQRPSIAHEMTGSYAGGSPRSKTHQRSWLTREEGSKIMSKVLGSTAASVSTLTSIKKHERATPTMASTMMIQECGGG